MKHYQKLIIKDIETALPYVFLFSVLALLAISVYLLQDFTKIYHIYTTY